jgi:multidrug resistance efflux pump
MRFQRSGFRPYARESIVLPPVDPRKPARRLWLIRPRTILYVIGAVVLAGFAIDSAWIRGNGIIAGQLTAISPIVQARLERLYVGCLDHVTRGQRLAEFRNEETLQAAAQQLQQLQLALTQAHAGIDIADRQAQAALKLVDAQAALLKQQTAVLKAEDELLKQHYVATLVWAQARAAADRADADTRAAEFVYETKRAEQKRAELDAEVLQKRIASFVDSPELNGHFYLTAPTDGIVTQCTAMPGEVIAARTPIFKIFNPNDTYAIVFFSSSDLPNLARGQTFDISIGGFDGSVTATLTDFYPELSALPSSLTRYFWQEEKWSQYAPVRLDFTHLTSAQRSKIFAWAQLSASRTQSLNPWPSVWRHLTGAWHFVSTSFAAQQPKKP